MSFVDEPGWFGTSVPFQIVAPQIMVCHIVAFQMIASTNMNKLRYAQSVASDRRLRDINCQDSISKDLFVNMISSSDF